MDITFDSFFRRLAEATDIRSQQDLARALGVNRSAVTQAKRRGLAPEKWVLRLAHDLGLSPDWLAAGRGLARAAAPKHPAEDFFQVPKVAARLSAGGGSFEVEARVRDYYAFKRDWLARKGAPERMVLMDVSGNSMEPEIKEGDTVLVDQSQQGVMAGSIYAVGVEDTVMVKRLEKRPGALVLVSENPDYDPVLLRGDELANVRLIGKVVWIGR
ncbi:MAG TPA: S24 family peptidase, partial [Spirochaetales bacterium]|nr:S24 family peptidase [Spirochaetales bacterium]